MLNVLANNNKSMREIKFRAWDQGRWRTDTIRLKANGTLSGDFRHPIHICQCTGLKDKNGKEIYEGDLIVCNYCKEDAGVVEWNMSMLRFELRWGDRHCGNARHTRIDNWAAIIGNVYENPELLEKRD
jgi:uncharacterized phage protein (TIGR01671 family)